jgi:acetate kinase
MKPANPRILTINGGSSSIKFALFEAGDSLRWILEGGIEMVNFQSGLLGVSETSSDMRDLLAQEAGDVWAAEAMALFCYQAKKWIGSSPSPLRSVDWTRWCSLVASE